MTDDEPIIRYQALQVIKTVGFQSNTTAAAKIEQLIVILTDLVRDEQVPSFLWKELSLRLEACTCIGICLNATTESKELSNETRSEALNALMVEFAVVFPSITTIPFNPLHVEVRIQMIYAIAGCFNISECQYPLFLSYIDELFSTILQQNTHPLLSAAVVHTLSKYLAGTNRNRARIEQYYRQIIDELAKLISPKPAMLRLQFEINTFMSVWYRLPSDRQILTAKNTADDPVQLKGYAHLRKAYILSCSPTSLSIKDNLDELIRRAHVSPYSRLNDLKFKVDPFNGLQLVSGNPVVGEMQDYAEQPFILQTLRLAFKVTKIQFHWHSNLQKVFLTNLTTEPQGFVIQLPRKGLFTATPSFGTILKLESLAIVFSYKCDYTKPSSFIKEYVCLRSSNGFPLER